MRVYIVRHGQAAAAASDSARPLSPEGRAEVTRLGDYLAREGIRVSAVWHSSKVRARETAQLLADTGRLGGPLEARAGLRPDDDVSDVAVALEASDADVCIVGHMPHISILVYTLAAGAAVRFDTATMACLERIAPRAWRVLWHVSPATL